jgi:LEA14-like dessication related protein
MKGIVKLLLVAGTGAVIWWGPTLLALYNLTCNVIAVYPTTMTGSRISAVVTVKLKNNSGTLLNMQSIVADIMLNGLKIAQVNQIDSFPILPQSEQNINIGFTIDAQIVGAEIMRQLMAQNLQNYVLDVKGSLSANNHRIPFDSYWTMKDFKI